MVDLQQVSYEEEFEELKCIGRGNFGAAFLVRLKNPPEPGQEVYFIAKKILLGQLTFKEQEGALLEVICAKLIEIGELVEEPFTSEYRRLQRESHRQGHSHYYHGILRRGRLVFPHQDEEDQRGLLHGD